MFAKVSRKLITLLIAMPVWFFFVFFTPSYIGAFSLDATWLHLDTSGISETVKGIVYSSTGIFMKLIGAVLVAYIIMNIPTYFGFAKNMWNSKRLLVQLSINDFKKKFVSSYLGSIWGFIMPLVQIVTFWFVFQVGFDSKDVGTCPYILWLIAGIVPWFFIADSVLSGTSVFLEYSFLVKKIVFKIELLPFVKVLSSFYVHIFFVALIFVAFLFQGYPLTIYAVQVIYYIVCLFALLFALTLLLSTLNVFIRDVGQVVSVLIQIGFWFTPIGWVFGDAIHGTWGVVFKLNPFFYIVQGYRNSFVYGKWFWDTPVLTCYFWIFVLAVMAGSIKTYNRLKPHFADLI